MFNEKKSKNDVLDARKKLTETKKQVRRDLFPNLKQGPNFVWVQKANM